MAREQIGLERLVAIVSALVVAVCVWAPRDADAVECVARCLAITCRQNPADCKLYHFSQAFILFSPSGSTTAVVQPMVGFPPNQVKDATDCSPVCTLGTGQQPSGGWDAINCAGPYDDLIDIQFTTCHETS